MSDQQTLLRNDLGLRCEASTLATALKVVLPFAKGQLASYHGVRLTADAGVLTLETTDGDRKANTSLPVNVSAEGVVVVPADVLDGFIRNVEGAVEMRVDGDRLSVSAGASTLDLRWIEQVEWPQFKEPDGDEFDLTPYWPSLSRITWAEAGSENKAESAHCMRFDDGGIVVACIDCLAALDVPGLKAATNVPMTFIKTLMATIDGEVSVRFSERMVAFRSGPTTWLSRTVVDSFPGWRRLLRPQTERTLIVAKDALQGALKRTGVLPEESGFKRMSMHRIDDELILTATGPDVGTITDVIECSGTYMEPDLVLKIARLSAIVKHSTEDELTFDMANDAYKHLQMTQGNWMALVMPLRPSGPTPATKPGTEQYPTTGKSAK